MPNASELTNLRDIHMPHAVSAWPPGPAYYALAGLCIIIILVLIRHKKHRQYNAPKREALATLESLEKRYTQTPKPNMASDITALLKRVALVYHPRTDVASLHGQDWLLFLQETSKNIDFQAIQTSLIDAPFNPNSEEDLTHLFCAARRWIKQRRKKCLS